jgi:excisionase family DNA binding protein
MIGGSNRLLSCDDLAELLGVPKRTVQGYWRAWGLPGYKVGKALRFKERDVMAWLESRRA